MCPFNPLFERSGQDRMLRKKESPNCDGDISLRVDVAFAVRGALCQLTGKKQQGVVRWWVC